MVVAGALARGAACVAVIAGLVGVDAAGDEE
jgi:hypothetical protein